MPLSESEEEVGEEDLESIEGLHQSITRQRSRLGKLMGRVESLQSLAASLEGDDVRPCSHVVPCPAFGVRDTFGAHEALAMRMRYECDTMRMLCERVLADIALRVSLVMA